MAAQDYGSQTWMPHFLPDVRRQIVDNVPGLTVDRVFRSNYPVEDLLANPPADKFIALFMPNFPVDQRAVSGGGTLNTPFDATLETTVCVRLEADIETRSTQAMEDEANGTDEFLRLVIKSLQMYPGPTDDATGLYKFRRPMRLKPEGFRVEKAKRGERNTRWTVAYIMWEVSFVSDLGQPYY